MTSNADKFAALFGTPAQNEPPPGHDDPHPSPRSAKQQAPSTGKPSSGPTLNRPSTT